MTNDLTIVQYMEFVEFMIDQLLDNDSDEDSDKESEISAHSSSDISIWTALPTWPDSPVSPTSSITSAFSISSLSSLLTAYSDVLLSGIPDMCDRVFMQFVDVIGALHDEVEKCWVLNVRLSLSCAPQLHLLQEWALLLPQKFRCKLCVDADVFDEVMTLIQPHPIFYNKLNNPQLPVTVQLAIFLNGIDHYDNAATTEDISDWVGVSVGTIYNCYKQVMIVILQLHDQAINFDPLDHEDQIK
ncbi:uncharacterized protein EDB91DRAFT_1257571 [Suillus paluster]|uniref:uncharacterized protein n=1 Tax=Suillus paluster TaxID=48578 RepID=UPI001B885F3C|nr:uncharacterized protein EDB91DRAFT_1257571 [Suillus paluster]KAG1719537.1 hypothetical protein EDB91DRAFT_1257571 [Suillus paluster]